MGRLPNLKRINIGSELELKIWLKKNADFEESIILTIHSDVSHRKFVSRELLSAVLTEHGWKIENVFTLGSGDLRGYVISM